MYLNISKYDYTTGCLFILYVIAHLLFLISLWTLLLILTGVSTLRQAFIGATPAARCLWKQWRRRDPFYGGGYRGNATLLDERSQPQGS